MVKSETHGVCRVIYVFKNHILDADRRELRRDTTLIPVEPQVFDLILYLVRNRDRVVSKDDLINAIWGGRIVSESALTTRINAARTAIGDSGKAQHFIRTLPRKGVRFVGEVREEPADPAQPSAASRSELPVVVRAEARAFCVLMGEDEAATRSALRSSRDLVVTNLKARGGRILDRPPDDPGEVEDGDLQDHEEEDHEPGQGAGSVAAAPASRDARDGTGARMVRFR